MDATALAQSKACATPQTAMGEPSTDVFASFLFSARLADGCRRTDSQAALQSACTRDAHESCHRQDRVI